MPGTLEACTSLVGRPKGRLDRDLRARDRRTVRISLHFASPGVRRHRQTRHRLRDPRSKEPARIRSARAGTMIMTGLRLRVRGRRRRRRTRTLKRSLTRDLTARHRGLVYGPWQAVTGPSARFGSLRRAAPGRRIAARRRVKLPRRDGRRAKGPGGVLQPGKARGGRPCGARHAPRGPRRTLFEHRTLRPPAGTAA